MLTSRPPRAGSPLRSSRGNAGDALRIAELMWQSPRTPGRSSSSPAPVGVASASLAGMCPTWSDAVTQMSVNQSVQAQLKMLVQPRLDSFADRLGSIVAAAQNELRELERSVERSEARVESRLAGLEGRVTLLADCGARTEHRERDLNTRIAGIAGSLFKDTEGAAALEMTRGHRLDVLERTMQARSERLEVAEENCRKSARSFQKFDDRLAELEDRGRSVDHLADELRSLMAASTATSSLAAPEQAARLGALETQVQSIMSAVEGNAGSQSGQAMSALEGRVDALRTDIEALATQLTETGRELRTQLAEQAHRHEEPQQMPCTSYGSNPSEMKALATRLDDFNLRVGALKVKTDGLEGRLCSGLERSERVERAREWPAELEDSLRQRINNAMFDVSSRLDVLEARLEGSDDAWDEIVEKVVERRLEELACELPPDIRRPRPRLLRGAGTGAGCPRDQKGARFSSPSAAAARGEAFGVGMHLTSRRSSTPPHARSNEKL